MEAVGVELIAQEYTDSVVGARCRVLAYSVCQTCATFGSPLSVRFKKGPLASSPAFQQTGGDAHDIL